MKTECIKCEERVDNVQYHYMEYTLRWENFWEGIKSVNIPCPLFPEAREHLHFSCACGRSVIGRPCKDAAKEGSDED